MDIELDRRRFIHKLALNILLNHKVYQFINDRLFSPNVIPISHVRWKITDGQVRKEKSSLFKMEILPVMVCVCVCVIASWGMS